MSNYGRFSDNPQTEWVSDPGQDRDMVLLRDFSYIDPDGKIWNAPIRCRVNGASIPMLLWSTVGSPYTGDYRNATIVHDVACQEVKTPADRKAADKMFYFACLAGGCSVPQARMLYLGVRTGAWASLKTGVLAQLVPKNLLFRLPSVPKLPEELLMRETFNHVAARFAELKEADDFAKLESIVDEELRHATGL
jgi:hypothetical protein